MVEKNRSELDKALLHNELFKQSVKYQERIFKANEIILKKGKRYSYFCFLRKGKAKVVLKDDNDKTLHPIISDINSGEVFGAMSLFDDAPANADVIALTDIELVEIDKASFLALSKSHPEIVINIALDFVQILFNRINRMNEKTLDLFKEGLALTQKK